MDGGEKEGAIRRMDSAMAGMPRAADANPRPVSGRAGLRRGMPATTTPHPAAAGAGDSADCESGPGGEPYAASRRTGYRASGIRMPEMINSHFPAAGAGQPAFGAPVTEAAPGGEPLSGCTAGRPPRQQHQRIREDPHKFAAIGSAEASRAAPLSPGYPGSRVTEASRAVGGGPVPARPAIAPAAAPGCRRRSARSRRFPGG